MNGAAKRVAATRSHERFRITSYLQFFREADSLPAIGTSRPQLSFFFFAKKFFRAATRRRSAITDRGYRSGSNEVETGKYSGSWLPRVDQPASSFPPSPPNAFEDWPWEIVSSHSSA